MLTIIFLLICSAVSAQNLKEIVSDTSYVEFRTTPDSSWFYVSTTTYSDGSFSSTGLRLGAAESAATFLINVALDGHRSYSNSIRVVASSAALNSTTSRVSNMTQLVAGKTYFNLVADLFSQSFIGRYSVLVDGQPTFQADMIRQANGNMRLRRVDNQVLYNVNLLSDRSFRLFNVPGAGASADVAEWQLNKEGRVVFSNTTRTVRLVRLDGTVRLNSR